VSSRLASRSAIALALLAAGGCDYWNNLVAGKAVARANLEVDVVDAWTGEAMQGAKCSDDRKLLAIEYIGNGAYGQENAPTGHYTINCDHPWYHDGQGEVSLTPAGARIVVKLARKGMEDWYPDAPQKVGLVDAGGLVRYPKNVDWSATPEDEGGHFLYEWTFQVNNQFNHGPLQAGKQPPKEAYSPHFHAKVTRESGVKQGRDRVTLKVYSILLDPKQPELVGVDSADIEWVPNQLPVVEFDRDGFPTDSNGNPLLRLQVDCNLSKKKPILLHLADYDGQCDAVRLWGLDPRSVPYFEMNLPCDPLDPKPSIPLKDPLEDRTVDPADIPSTKGPNGSTEYLNTLIAEITDDNGEKARDTVRFRTFRNVPPIADLEFDEPRTHYLMDDSVHFVLTAQDLDGSFDTIAVPWISSKTNQPMDTGNVMFNIPEENVVKFSGFVHFHYPESTTFYAKVSDNCAESYTTTPKTVSVTASRPPVFTRFKPSYSVRGDTVVATIDLTVTDPDASYKDRISSIRVKWADLNLAGGGIDSVSPNVPTYSWDELTHIYVHPAPNAPIAIQIRARDAHDSTSETSYSFTPPGSLAHPVALPLR
jgi:hypothetical protein